MVRQLSTSVSDFALALSVYYVVYHLLAASQTYAAVGLAIQGIAASIGVVRFALHRPEGTNTMFIHKLLSWFATATGMALIGYQFCQNYHSKMMGYAVASFSGVVTATAQFQNASNKQLFTEACSGLSVLTMLVLSALNFNWSGVIASLIYILAGAIIGSTGTLMNIQRVDLLHYALIVGNLFFLAALT